MTKNQIRFDETKGKTIEKVFSDYGDDMLIVFNDQTFCLLGAYECDDEVTLEDGDFSLDQWGQYANELLDLGVITQPKFDEYTADQSRQANAWMENRRKEYEAMKAEFKAE